MPDVDRPAHYGPAGIGAKIVRGASWKATAMGVQVAVGVIVRLVLARFLAPSHFGIVAMAIVFTDMMATLTEFGMAAALIQRRQEQLRDVHLDTAFAASVLLSLVAFLLVVVAGAPFAAWFYNEPVLHSMIVAIGLALVLRPFVDVHRALLVRDLRFGALAIVDVSASLVSGVVAVWMAVSGWGVWSLAWQGVMLTGISVPLLWWLSEWRPRFWCTRRALRELAGFGAFVTAERVLTALTVRLDVLLIGKLLGASSLGAYTMAAMLTQTVRRKVGTVADQVMFPVYARYQDDERQLRHFYLTCVKYLCLVTFPIMSALCLLAAEVVDICLGAEWGTAVVPLRWLALASMIESAGWTGATVIRACGLPGLQLKIRSMLSVVVIVPGVVVGAYLGGAAGAACAIAAISLVSRAVYFHWLRRLIGLELRAFVLALRHGAIAAALVAAGVLGARMLVVSDGDTLAAAVVLATIALTAYARVGLKEECATVLSHLRATSKRSPAGRASVISEAGAAE